jgi:predicted O-linked N-acetylglucosamine transferase (SPINDLY family)
LDAPAILEEARRWDERHAAPLARAVAPHANDRTPERRLRVGYVSPDFRHHANSHFFLPLIAEHEHERFEIFCYASVAAPDDLTEGTRRHADHWRDIAPLDDAGAAAVIREDRIDVLVDLAMHAKSGRPALFARKPAPVQIAWRAVGRAGVGQAMNLTLPELVARTPDEYVAIAVRLAQDLDRLEGLRRGLRPRMEKSPLMDAPRFARGIERAYREAWGRWCASSSRA